MFNLKFLSFSGFFIFHDRSLSNLTTCIVTLLTALQRLCCFVQRMGDDLGDEWWLHGENSGNCRRNSVMSDLGG